MVSIFASLRGGVSSVFPASSRSRSCSDRPEDEFAISCPSANSGKNCSWVRGRRVGWTVVLSEGSREDLPGCSRGTVFSVEHTGQVKGLPANPTGLENFWSHCWQRNLKIGSFVRGPEELEASAFAGAGISARQEVQ